MVPASFTTICSQSDTTASRKINRKFSKAEVKVQQRAASYSYLGTNLTNHPINGCRQLISAVTGQEKECIVGQVVTASQGLILKVFKSTCAY